MSLLDHALSVVIAAVLSATSAVVAESTAVGVRAGCRSASWSAAT